MSSVTSSDFTSSNQVRDESEIRVLTEILNKPEISMDSIKNRVPRPALTHKLRKISKSLKENEVELLLKKKCSEGGLLKYAARVGDIKLVKLQIRQGADVNASGVKSSSPLHEAAWYGHPKIIKLLIKNGAHLESVSNGPTKYGYTPLHLACLNNKIECVKVLLKYGASVTPKSVNAHHPIHTAVFKNYVEIAALLLNHGADVNLRFDNTFFYNEWDESIYWKDMDLTLLHCSIARKYEEMTALLLEHGADIHLKTRSNKTSLMHAVEANDPELVKSFLAKGANPNDQDIYGEPVLFFTVLNANNHNQSMYYNKREFYFSREKLEVVQLLYAAGADINAKFGSNGSSNSLVYYTSMYGQVSITVFVLHDTNFNWRNIDYATIKASRFTEEASSPNDRYDFKYIECLRKYLDISKTVLLYYTISRHMIGFPVKEELLSAIYYSSDLRVSPDYAQKIESIKKDIEADIRYAKQTMFGNTKISLWQLLTCKMTELVRLSFYKDFRSLCRKDYLGNFCYLYSIFEFRLKTAIERSTSIEKSSKILFDIFYNHLPYDCCEKIATCFDDKELENFIKNSSNDIVC
ncbi:ankyrin-2-like [Microplitis demolitor]|uniref:ankyrin-2-like n=1 Tax=Microplitis demolitor TaxID=69319 RepID=UPI00235B5D0D|nr:ankyrin-2-like [Microplitis demolitor]